MRARWLVLACGLAAVAPAHAAERDAAPTGRFAVHGARIEAAPAAVGNGRFRVTADLVPATRAPLVGSGFRMQASLEAKASSATCGPEPLFSDGFENPI